MNHFLDRFRVAASVLACAALVGGCASTGSPHDPLEPVNRGIYTFNEALDTTVLKPAAELYRGIVPRVVRTGVHNVFSNINDVIVALNNLLQGKFTHAASDTGRLVVNTTVGLLGIFDVATPLGLEKHNEDFGQTLGYWGVGDGPYLVLPVFGPSNLRDTVGLFVDYKTDPITYVDPNRDRNILLGVRVVNRRSELLDATSVLETAALDKYLFVRDAYLQRRRSLIHDGNPPREPEENLDRKPKPTGESGESGRHATDTDPWQGSILVSGEPPTPARLEALEKAANGENAVQSAEQKPRDAKRDVAASQLRRARVVRFWAPPQR